MKLLLSGTKLSQFYELITNLKYITEFITFNFSEEGIYSQGISGDHCAIFELKINNEWFDDYEIDGSDMTNFTLKTEWFSKIINAKQPSQHMIIEYYGKPDNIIIRFASIKSESKNLEFPKEFYLPLIDYDYEHLTIPEVEYDADFGVESKSLSTMNDQLSLFNETLSVYCSDEKIYFNSKGVDGELKVTLYDDNCDHITEYSIAEDLILNLDFSIKHFSLFCKFSKISDVIFLSFANAYPLKFEYVFPEDSKIKLRFYLAPKISE